MNWARLLLGTFHITYEGGCATYSNLFLWRGPGWCSCLGRRKQPRCHMSHTCGELAREPWSIVGNTHPRTKTVPSVFSAISAVVGSRPPAGQGVHGCELAQCLGEEPRVAARIDLESLMEHCNSQGSDPQRCGPGQARRAMDLCEGEQRGAWWIWHRVRGLFLDARQEPRHVHPH